jgi:hypothetical protein
MYQITNYTLRKAQQLGVTVTPSTNSKKKIDVYKNEQKVASIGARGYGDYPTFLQSQGEKIANEKRRLYKLRHNKDRHTVNTNGWYCDQLLW